MNLPCSIVAIYAPPVGILSGIKPFKMAHLLFLGIEEGDIHMHKLSAIAAISALAGLSSGATAADLGGMKDSVASEQSTTTNNRSSWTGPSAGTGGGGVSQVTSVTSSIADPDYGGAGALGTLQLGYDYQLPGSFLVVGAFANYDMANAEARTTKTTHVSYDNGWTIGGRVGFALTNSALCANGVLLYGMAGFSQGSTSNNWAHDVDNLESSSPHQYPESMTFNGWTTGLGVETSLGGNWSIKTEYRYSNFSSQTYTITDRPDHRAAPSDVESTVDLSTQSARMILSYRFGGF
jgi:outer membrane immunogenic protein